MIQGLLRPIQHRGVACLVNISNPGTEGRRTVLELSRVLQGNCTLKIHEVHCLQHISTTAYLGLLLPLFQLLEKHTQRLCFRYIEFLLCSIVPTFRNIFPHLISLSKFHQIHLILVTSFQTTEPEVSDPFGIRDPEFLNDWILCNMKQSAIKGRRSLL